MGAIGNTLRQELTQPEFSEGYAESFHDAYVATQIKVLREQNAWTQEELAGKIGTTQTAISRIENVNYSSWNIRTLKKLARAFRLRLKVSFETYGSLLHDVESFSRDHLQRTPRECDPELLPVEDALAVIESATATLHVDIGQYRARKQGERPSSAFGAKPKGNGIETEIFLASGTPLQLDRIPPGRVPTAQSVVQALG